MEGRSGAWGGYVTILMMRDSLRSFSPFPPLRFLSHNLPFPFLPSCPPSCLPGLAVVDGQLIEMLHVEEAHRLLATQLNIEAMEASVHVQAGMRPHSAMATTSDTTH